ncbi:MAG: hypothetical protein VX640_11850 [Pseudomonadota bacterium]|nr:hypothetical protein [Pseudomonadota bacterium]
MYLYYDESIRTRGGFIVGALVGSSIDLSKAVRAEWIRLGLNADEFEYKSSAPKSSDVQQADLRAFINDILRTNASLALAVLPLECRRDLGLACVRLTEQLALKGHLDRNLQHYLYTDNDIKLSSNDIKRLRAINIEPFSDCDSVKIAGIQVADHAAHILGSMLLESMGVIQKQVQSSYPEEYRVESVSLGWELWGDIRYNFFSEVEYDPHDSASAPFAIVEGHGLIIANECGDRLKENALRTFGKSYLGCTV